MVVQETASRYTFTQNTDSFGTAVPSLTQCLKIWGKEGGGEQGKQPLWATMGAPVCMGCQFGWAKTTKTCCLAVVEASSSSSRCPWAGSV